MVDATSATDGPELASWWTDDPAAARALQVRLAERVEERDRMAPLRLLGGLDVHYDPARGLAFAAAVLLDAGTLELVESAQVAIPVRFPYRTGLLSFREAPAGLMALQALSRRPDLLLVDGHGRAHPRRFGLACHVGVLADLPTVGVAKSRLVGRHEEPASAAGSSMPLEDKGELIGAVLRSRTAGRPIYVSVGHRVALETAVDLVAAGMRSYRLPEPIRLADRLSRAHR
jgi:deoxyribonuclease V